MSIVETKGSVTKTRRTSMLNISSPKDGEVSVTAYREIVIADGGIEEARSRDDRPFQLSAQSLRDLGEFEYKGAKYTAEELLGAFEVVMDKLDADRVAQDRAQAEAGARASKMESDMQAARKAELRKEVEDEIRAEIAAENASAKTVKK